MIQIGLLGARGRMGKWVAQLIPAEFAQTAILKTQANSGDSLEPLLETDVVIDFSSSNAMHELAQIALQKSASQKSERLPAFVIGSTAWKTEELQTLEKLATRTPVLIASNFSSGIFIVSEILKQFSPLLKKVGYSPVLVETHHRHKKDAPSGTALSLQKSINPESPQSTQTHAIRIGEVIGDHDVTFYSTSEQIKISHSAQDRSIWARGAIQVAIWLTQNQSSKSPIRDQGKILGIEDYFKSLG